MEELIQELETGGYSCIVCKGTAVRRCVRRGIIDLYTLQRKEPSLLAGADVADKVVGKGAAALLIVGGVRRLYAGVVSRAALDLLAQTEMKVRYGHLVERIINRTGDGPCPVEEACQGAVTAEACLPRITEFVQSHFPDLNI
ncbi:MAG: DUF1893 domain-containing protein [Porphyromonadaceae bacterium]|nr:DUF1893 domain-containing protein [Porphyromonadaceae bacterium]